MEHLLANLFPPRNDAESPLTPVDEVEEPTPGIRERRPNGDPLLAAISEAEDAIASVMGGSSPVQLAPQSSRIRQLQHQLAERYAVSSRSRGREPNRRVEISRDGFR
jgi:hypothetical protein